MYCRKCGKAIPDEQEYCDECRKLDIVAGNDTGYSSKSGFAVALVAAIIAATAAAITPFANGLLSPIAEKVGIVLSVIIALVYLGSIVPSIVMGVRSVRKFVVCSRENKPKPVSTLVLGIVALALSLWVIVSVSAAVKTVLSASAIELPLF